VVDADAKKVISVDIERIPPELGAEESEKLVG
jgi:hypothetical protein